ncbi:hypoxanthine-guanine phosphoribosyltransferase [Aurantivibrio plasticivorans]
MNSDQFEAIRQNAELLWRRDQIENAIECMAKDITSDFRHSKPILVGVMNGALPFFARLMLSLRFPLEVDYLHASRYGDQCVGDELSWTVEPSVSLQGRDVIIVDDILDEGITLAAIADYCRRGGAEKVATAVLVAKPKEKNAHVLSADYVGLEVPDKFVVGYGMDVAGYGRNLENIYALDDQLQSLLLS